MQGHGQEGVLRHGLPQPGDHLPLHPDSQAQLRGELPAPDTEPRSTGEYRICYEQQV